MVSAPDVSIANGVLVLDTATVTVHMFDGDSLPALRGPVEGEEAGQDWRRWMKFKITVAV